MNGCDGYIDSPGLLIRQSESNKHCLIDLTNRQKLMIGRSENCDLMLKETLRISRQHVILEYRDNDWFITDQKSGNGSFVNGKKLEPYDPYALKEGDIVELGKDETSQEQTVYIYKYTRDRSCLVTARKVVKPKEPRARLQVVCTRSMQSPSALLKVKMRQLEQQYAEQLKEQQKQMAALQQEKVAVLQQLESVQSQQQLMQTQKDQELVLKQQQVEKLACEKINLCEELELVQEEFKEKEGNKLKEAQQQQKEKEILLQEKEALGKALDEMQQEQQNLERERQREQQQHQQHMDSLQQEKLAIWEQLEGLQDQHHKLQIERKKELQLVQEQLEKEQTSLVEVQQAKEAELGVLQGKLADVLGEYRHLLDNKHTEEQTLRQELEEQRTALQLNVQEKESEMKQMSEELGQVRQQMTEVSGQLQKEKVGMLSSFEDTMEVELQCPICNELFIEATSLGCSHSFCSYCIEKWMEKKRECPECRGKITSWVRSRVLDNYIDKVVGLLSEDLQAKRKEALDDRKAEVECYNRQKKQRGNTATNAIEIAADLPPVPPAPRAQQRHGSQSRAPQQHGSQRAAPQRHGSQGGAWYNQYEGAAAARPNRWDQQYVGQQLNEMGYHPQLAQQHGHHHADQPPLTTFFETLINYPNNRNNHQAGYVAPHHNRNPFFNQPL